MNDYEHRITGEPTAYNAPANFDRQYDLLREKLKDEHERADKIEGKAATLLAGTIAIIGFSFEHVANWAHVAVLFFFALPLWNLYHAYKTISWDDAPSPEEVAYK